MSKRTRNSLSDFPEQCYAVIDDKLCIVTRGEKGWKRVQISTENNAANHELVALKNKELGVTPEEARLLVTGAVIGWDTWITPVKRLSTTREIFEVEVCRLGSFGTASVKLPAKWSELQDVLDKARITDDSVLYSVEVLNSEPDYLCNHITDNANLYELNYLAERLSVMDSWQMNCFEGLCMMDSAKNQNRAIPMDLLINMTRSLADCQIVHKVYDDESLGKFYGENGFVAELETLSEKIFPWLDYSKIGKEMREAEGGVFTHNGYVVQNGKMSTEYSSDKLQIPKKPDYVFKLEIAAAPRGDAPNDELTADLKLPATAGDIKVALAKVGSESLRESVFYEFDSILPQITGKLFADMDNFDVLNELAEQVQTLERQGKLTIYKAMLSVPSLEVTFYDALDLSYRTDKFTLLQEVCDAADYARKEIEKCGVPLNDELYAVVGLSQYGKKLMEQNNVLSTDYGMLISPDGQTPEQCLEKYKQEMDDMTQTMM